MSFAWEMLLHIVPKGANLLFLQITWYSGAERCESSVLARKVRYRADLANVTWNGGSFCVSKNIGAVLHEN
jgi:hypothetical protein